MIDERPLRGEVFVVFDEADKKAENFSSLAPSLSSLASVSRSRLRSRSRSRARYVIRRTRLLVARRASFIYRAANRGIHPSSLKKMG
jgi:hypothetical protein